MRTGVSIKTTKYSNFKGVDFSTDASLVDPSRSPYAVNMIADTGGMPEKRAGYRKLAKIQAPVNGLFYGIFEDGIHLLAHGGDRIYRFSEENEPVLLREGVSDSQSCYIRMNGKIWILTGNEFLFYDGKEIKDAKQDAYIPTTIIAREPNGGGVVFEAINLLQPKQKNEFIADGNAKEYQLSYVDLDEDPVTAVVNGQEMTEGSGFSVDRAGGLVQFDTAPEAPVVGKEANVIITFSKTVEGYAERITQGTILFSYGVGSADRMIVSGNAKYPNLDYTSGFNDPTYFPDNGYAVVGMESSAIKGYRRIGEYLAIIKENTGQDSTVYLRSADLNDDGEAVFPLRQSIAGVGAVSKRCFGSILDEQLFLSDNGVCAITTNALTAERIIQNRSFFVDNKLLKEPDLAEAMGVSFGGMFMVFVGGHVYLLDGRQNKSYRAKSQSEYIYECYFWDNVPASCVLNAKNSAKEDLYFGSDTGDIYKFNYDLDNMERYSDDGQAICAIWSTVADDDGDVSLLKTMIKKGNCITIKPYTRSSAKICFRTERDSDFWEAVYEPMDIFDWTDIDFSRFTFNSNDAPQEVMFNTKVKKYKRLQILIKNDALNEGFGLFGVVKHFVVGNFAKR